MSLDLAQTYGVASQAGTPTLNNIGNLNDGNSSTAASSSGFSSGTGASYYTGTAIVTLPRSFTVNSISFVFSGSEASFINISLQILVNGAWITLWSSGNVTSIPLQTQTFTGPWTNVTAAQFAYTLDNRSNFSYSISLYEIFIYGANYADSGLRIDTSTHGILSLGAILPPLGSGTKLRFMNKSGQVCALGLTAPGNFDDSGLRFYDGTTIWAIAKVVS